MKQPWLKNTLPIAAIFAFRMLGLFMLIPVFSVYALQLSGANPTWIGIALGSYGFSQGLLQIPFGLLSDRFGRKRLIRIGLLLFMLGSLWGALTHSIYGMFMARLIQGAGAIGSVLIALLADVTPDVARTKAMAVIGITIGLSFSLAMVLSPLITQYAGLSGIFLVMVALAICGLILLQTTTPTPIREPFHFDRHNYWTQLTHALANKHLQRLNLSIFCQHLILTATFFAVPLLLHHYQRLGVLTRPWHFYLPLMLGAFICMLPFIRLAEKRQMQKIVLVGAVFCTALTQLLLTFYSQHWLMLGGLMFVYFIAFNILEANLPALVSRQAGFENKGTAMGIYSSSQFLGIFAGGLCAGLAYQYGHYRGIFLFNGVVALLWLMVAYRMQPNCYQFTIKIPYQPEQLSAHKLTRIEALSGMLQVVVSEKEQMLYLRVEKKGYQSGSAEKIMQE